MYANDFAKLWFRLTRELNVHMDNELAPSLTEGQFTVLEYLFTHDQVKPSDLIQHLATTPAAITTLLDRMEKNELIIRERDTDDRRIVWIRVTSKGNLEVKRGISIRDQFLNERLNQISSHNQKLLVYLLKKISREEKEDEIKES